LSALREWVARVICTRLLVGDNKLDHERRAPIGNSQMADLVKQRR